MRTLKNVTRRVLRILTDPFDFAIMSGINRGRRWRVKSGVFACWFGTYEKDEAALIAALIPPGATVFDVGAHAGYYTLAASRLTGPTGRVVAFEPDPLNLGFLRENLAGNRVGNVTVVDRPVGSEHGQVVSFVTNKSFTYESGIRASGGQPMTTVTIDSVVAEGMPSPDVVKMDIEGFEAFALAGARAVMAERRTAWLISLHGVEPALQSLALLQNAGYDVYDVKNGKLVGEVPEFPIYSILGLPKGRRFPAAA